MELTPIEVICHSGYKADEYPKGFTWKGEAFDIVEILDRWYEGYWGEGNPAADYFKVKTNYGRQYLIKHVKELDAWYLVNK